MVRLTLIVGFCLMVVILLALSLGPVPLAALVLMLGFPGAIGLGAAVALILVSLFTLFTRKTV